MEKDQRVRLSALNNATIETTQVDQFHVWSPNGLSGRKMCTESLEKGLKTNYIGVTAKILKMHTD